jgi:hypothetical protein
MSSPEHGQNVEVNDQMSIATQDDQQPHIHTQNSPTQTPIIVNPADVSIGGTNPFTGNTFYSKQGSVMATPANVQVSIVTQEDKERYQKKIDLARSKIVFPDNPCLFTAGVKIQSHNYKMAQRLSKMSNSKRRGSRSTQQTPA